MSVVVGDFNGDGKDDLAGMNANGAIFYTTDVQHWNRIPGWVTSLAARRR